MKEAFNIFQGVYGLCVGMIRQFGDQAIAGGTFLWLGENGYQLRVNNANNHQTTYGVLGAAVAALSDYMSQHGCATGTFSIHDGLNQVGEGTIGPQRH